MFFDQCPGTVFDVLGLVAEEPGRLHEAFDLVARRGGQGRWRRIGPEQLGRCLVDRLVRALGRQDRRDDVGLVQEPVWE